MTNFTLHKHMDGDNPPSAELAKSVCPRYSHLAERLAGGPISEELLRTTHRAVDAQAPARPDAKRPPIRTFWHALYYPEERRVKFSYYLGDLPDGSIRRTEYLEFKLTPTTGAPQIAVTAQPVALASQASASAAPAPATTKPDELTLEKVPDAASLVPSLAAKHPNLRVLQLMGTNVTDADLVHLRGLAKLESLGLRSTAVTGAGLAQLTSLRKLGYINLADTKLTDAQMPALGKLPGITGLNLSNTKITDAGLIHLKSMSRLTKLNLKGTPVTDAGIAEAKEWLPFWAKVTR